MSDVPQPLQVEDVTPRKAASPPPPTMVGEKYWLGRGVTILDEAVSSLQTGAERVATAAAWFWSVYVGTSIVGLSVLDRDLSRGESIWLAVPMVLLLAGYACAHWAAAPIKATFDGRYPDEIRAVHNSSVDKKWKRLMAAVVTTALGAAAVAIALPLALVSTEGPAADEVQIAVREIEERLTAVVSGRIEGASDLTVTIEPAGSVAAITGVVIGDDGAFGANVETETADRYVVTVTWEEAGRTHSVTETETLTTGS